MGVWELSWDQEMWLEPPQGRSRPKNLQFNLMSEKVQEIIWISMWLNTRFCWGASCVTGVFFFFFWLVVFILTVTLRHAPPSNKEVRPGTKALEVYFCFLLWGRKAESLWTSSVLPQCLKFPVPSLLSCLSTLHLGEAMAVYSKEPTVVDNIF